MQSCEARLGAYTNLAVEILNALTKRSCDGSFSHVANVLVNGDIVHNGDWRNGAFAPALSLDGPISMLVRTVEHIEA